MTSLGFDDINVFVEIGFSTTAGANTVPFGGLLSDIVWTDVTDYVRGVSFSQGRSTELDSFQTGSAQIVLSNADRRFDPAHSSGPYFGALTPMRPVQITISHRDEFLSTNIYPQFFGYVDGWPQSYELIGDATVTVNLSDTFKVLNNIKLPGYYKTQIASETPTTWLRFDDGTSSTIANSGTTETPWRWVKLSNNTQPYGSNTTVPGIIQDDSNGAGDFSSVFYAIGPVEPSGLTADRTIEFWIQTTSKDAETYGLLGVNAADSGVYAWMASAFGLGLITACIGQPGTGTFKNLVSNVIVNDGKPHHVVLVFGTTTALWVDGERAETPTTSQPCEVVYPGANRLGGTPYYSSAYYSTAQFSGVIDEYADYSRCFTAQDVADHYALGITQFASGERTDERAQRILDMISWPADAVDFGVGVSNVQGINTEGKTVLAALQECEAAEQGILVANTYGGIDFLTRTSFSDVLSSSSITFGDSGSEVGYQEITIEYSDQDIANAVTVSRLNGATVTKTDATSQQSYWPRSLQITDLITDDDVFSSDLATYLLGRYKTPQVRIRSIGTTLRGHTSFQIDQLLSLMIGRRVVVKRRPQNIGVAINQTLQIQSVKGEITPDNIVFSFDLGPAPELFFVLDSSSKGVLNTGKLGF